jgi:hypothetical protein
MGRSREEEAKAITVLSESTDTIVERIQKVRTQRQNTQLQELYQRESPKGHPRDLDYLKKWYEKYTRTEEFLFKLWLNIIRELTSGLLNDDLHSVKVNELEEQNEYEQFVRLLWPKYLYAAHIDFLERQGKNITYLEPSD